VPDMTLSKLTIPITALSRRPLKVRIGYP
jgi:hypothetical protein